MSDAGQAVPPTPRQLMEAMEMLRGGNRAGALEHAERAIGSEANPAPYLAVASLAALQLGQPERAIGHLRRLIAINPADNASRVNLARALLETGKDAEALDLAEGSSLPAMARIEGYIRQKSGDPEGAVAAYGRAVQAEPNDPASWNNLGNIHASVDAFDKAIQCFERAITLAPAKLETYLNLAEVLRRADRGPARLKVMQDAADLAPDNRQVMIELAMAHAHVDELEPAIAILQQVIAHWPDFGEAHIELGRLYEALNRTADLATLIASIDSQSAPPEAAFLSAWLARREGRFEDAARYASQIPETIHPMRRESLIGAIEDRLGHTDAAFAAFERMNAAAVADTPARSGPTYRETVEADLATWSQQWADGWTAIDGPAMARSPIFLVGFPRSGTTLLDTMLMGLPEVSVLEERPMLATVHEAAKADDLATISPGRVAELRDTYWQAARTQGWETGRRLIDKHPLNMARIPLIYRMFPKARIILAERHPYDVVLSCFMANFQMNFAMSSFTSLEEAARTYDAVFSAWSRAGKLFPVDTRPVRYERLIEDAEAELRPVVDWLGLEWHDRALAHQATAQDRGRVKTASYSQIGEKIYTRARNRWHGYRRHLAPVLPVLQPWADKMGYETD